MTIAIEVEDLHVSYGDLQAVCGISFSVAPGEILGFLGPNGAGKSSTLKVLYGLLPPKSGTARVLGMDVTAQRSAVQARIGVCFEEKNLYADMSAIENLRFHARLFGIREPDTGALLQRVGLADRGGDRVETFSKGMRQRLMMARALVNRPDVLFLDEPTDGLDPVSSQAVRAIIRQEAERGAAVLLTTHDMAEADGLSDRVAFINEGELYAIDTPETLKLEHGRRTVRVQRRVAGELLEERIALDEGGAGERIAGLAAAPGLVGIHTEEATLEDIFVAMTGRGLEA
jgi:ABC-type multidrug transport system ATPase subunit